MDQAQNVSQMKAESTPIPPFTSQDMSALPEKLQSTVKQSSDEKQLVHKGCNIHV